MLASCLRYVLFVLLVLVGPGVALQRMLRLPIDTALVLPLGLGFGAVSYWLSLVSGVSWVFPALVCLVNLVLLLFVFVKGESWSRARDDSSKKAWACVATLVGLFSLTQSPWNRFSAEGEFLLDPFVASDTAFHVGLTRELTVGYPPQVPGVAGFPLGYHWGADLVRAAAHRWARVDPYDALARFEPTLLALGLTLTLLAVTRSLGALPWALTLVPWTLLLVDFSFVFARNPQAHWWADLLRGNLLISLFLCNPVVPGLTLSFASLVALDRHQKGQGRGWLVLGALLALAVPFFKVFLGAHLLLAIGLTALLRSGAHRALLPIALPLFAATFALVLGQGGATVAVRVMPLDLVRVTRETLALPPVHGASLIGWSLLWILASFGARLLGLPTAIRALRRGPLVGTALAVLALTAWPLGLLFRVSAREILPDQKVVNDAAYLIEQGGPVLWIFTALALAQIAGKGGRARLAALSLVALSVPSTVQFVLKKALLSPDPIPAATIRAMRALERASRTGQTVLQRPGARYPPLPVVLIGRRVPYERFTPYLTQFVSRDDLLSRHEIVHRFFQTHDAREALGIARSLGASFVCLYGSDRVGFETEEVLIPVHEEPGARVYRISEAGINPSESGRNPGSETAGPETRPRPP